MSDRQLLEGTLVVYHGSVSGHRGDLAFIRKTRINDNDRREYQLDLICYLGDECLYDGDYPITTFGDLWAISSDFTIVPIPKIPEPMKFGNYLVHGTPWRRTPEGWYTWANFSEQWKFAPDLVDECAMGDHAVYIGPLP